MHVFSARETSPVSALSDDGRLFAVTDLTRPNTVVVQSDDGQIDAEISATTNGGPIVWLGWSSTSVLIVRSRNRLAGWTVTDPNLEWSAELSQYEFVTLTPGAEFLVHSDGSSIQFRDANTGEDRGTLRYPDADPIRDISIAPDARRLAALYTTAKDGNDTSATAEMVVWNLESGEASKAAVHRGAVEQRLQWASPDLLLVRAMQIDDRSGAAAAHLVDLRGPEVMAGITLPDKRSQWFQLEDQLWNRTRIGSLRGDQDITGDGYIDVCSQVQFLDPKSEAHAKYFEYDEKTTPSARRVRVEVASHTEQAARLRATAAARYLQKEGVAIGPGDFLLRGTTHFENLGAELDRGQAKVPIPSMVIVWTLLSPDGQELWWRTEHDHWLSEPSRYQMTRSQSRAEARRDGVWLNPLEDVIYYEFPESDFEKAIREEMLTREGQPQEHLFSIPDVVAGGGKLGVPDELGALLLALHEDPDDSSHRTAVQNLLKQDLKLSPQHRGALDHIQSGRFSHADVQITLQQLREVTGRESKTDDHYLPRVAAAFPTDEVLTNPRLPNWRDELVASGLKAELKLPVASIADAGAAASRSGVPRTPPPVLHYSEDGQSLRIVGGGFGLEYRRDGADWDKAQPLPAYEEFADERGATVDFQTVVQARGTTVMVSNSTNPLDRQLFTSTRRGVDHLALSLDGRFLAYGNLDGVEMRDLEAGEPVATFPNDHTRGNGTFDFSPSGDLFAAAYNQLVVFDLENPGRFGPVDLPEIRRGSGSHDFAFSRDDRIVACTNGGDVLIYDLTDADSKSNSLPEPVTYSLRQSVRSLALNGDATLCAGLVWTSSGGSAVDRVEAWVWEVGTGRIRRRIEVLLQHMSDVEPARIALSPSGDELAIANYASVLLFDVATTEGELVSIRRPVVRIDPPSPPAEQPGGPSSSTGGAWPDSIATIDTPVDYKPVESVSFSDDGMRFAIGIKEKFFVIDINAGELEYELTQPADNSGRVQGSAIAPDHATAAFDRDMNMIFVYADAGRKPDELTTRVDVFNTFGDPVFADGGARILTGHQAKPTGNVVRKWDLRKGSIAKDGRQDTMISGIAVSRDGTVYATYDQYGVISILDPKNLTVERSLSVSEERTLIEKPQLAPNGKAIAAIAQQTNDVYLWGSERKLTAWPKNEPPKVLTHLAKPDSIAFDSEAGFLLVGIRDSNAQQAWIDVYDANSGALVAEFDPVDSYKHIRLAISPDDKTIGVLVDKTLRTYELAKILPR